MKLLFLLILLSGCNYFHKASNDEILLYCQDLNVLYQRIAVISSNIANAQTTRVPEGGYYKRKIVKDCHKGTCEVVDDTRPPILKYEPKHPDANSKGYVAYPNISLAEENYDQLRWERVSEVVVASSPVPANFFFKDPRAKQCFDKFPALKENKDYSDMFKKSRT